MNAIGDTLFGTRFDLKDGTVRGPWCPGGGTAGPLLLRLARHRRYPRLALFVFAFSLRIGWMAHPPFARGTGRRWTFFSFRRPSSPSFDVRATALEVLEVAEQPDGSLTVALPRSSTAGVEKDAGAAPEHDLAGYGY